MKIPPITMSTRAAVATSATGGSEPGPVTGRVVAVAPSAVNSCGSWS